MTTMTKLVREVRRHRADFEEIPVKDVLNMVKLLKADEKEMLRNAFINGVINADCPSDEAFDKFYNDNYQTTINRNQ
jgi:hypothetical protein